MSRPELLALLATYGIDTTVLTTRHGEDGDAVALRATQILLELAESICPSKEAWERLVK